MSVPSPVDSVRPSRGEAFACRVMAAREDRHFGGKPCQAGAAFHSIPWQQNGYKGQSPLGLRTLTCTAGYEKNRWRASAPAASGHRMLAGFHRLDARFQSCLNGRSQMSSFGSARFTFVSYAPASPGGPELGPARDVMNGAGVAPGALASSDTGSVDILVGKRADGCHRSPWLEGRMPSAAGKPNCVAAATIDLSRL